MNKDIYSNDPDYIKTEAISPIPPPMFSNSNSNSTIATSSPKTFRPFSQNEFKEKIAWLNHQTHELKVFVEDDQESIPVDYDMFCNKEIMDKLYDKIVFTNYTHWNTHTG